MQSVLNSERGTCRKAFAAAFPHTLPVLAGYLFIGMAFGVMIQEKGYHALWAMFMSLVIYAGSGQYLAVSFFAPQVNFFQIILMEFMVNIRHIFYGLSLIGRFENTGKKKPYLIFSLTDETYSLYFITKTPAGVREDQFLFAIAVLDHSYWILGSGIGALLGRLLPFNAAGIDFAMTALFLVILAEQWMESGKAWKNDERAERQGAREAECADGSEEIRETECADGNREIRETERADGSEEIREAECADGSEEIRETECADGSEEIREAECADGSEEIRETERADGTRGATGRPGNINRKSAAVGVLCALVCRLLFGEEQFILPAMICIMVILVAGRRMFEGADGDKVRKEVDQNAG